MFTKTKKPESTPQAAPAAVTPKPAAPAAPQSRPAATESKPAAAPTAAPAAAPVKKSAPSVLSNDLTIKGNVHTAGDIQIDGHVEGDIRAHLATVGESSTVKGEIVADDAVIHGRVIGRVRGLKVRLTSSARVEGDIIHKTIAIESGAHFEGSVMRNDDPLGENVGAAKAKTTTSSES